MSNRQKGRALQIYIANAFKKITSYVFSRADSGSGKFHKEDVTLPDYIPLHIEAKNHAVADIGDWWKQTLNGCPASKIPVLIYRLNYDKKPTVYMKLTDLILMVEDKVGLLSGVKMKIDFDDFMEIVKGKYGQKHR